MAMPREDIDINEYTRVPIMDVPTAYSLGCALLAAVPTGKARTELVRAAARTLREALVMLRDSWTASLKYGPADRRAFDVVADASWRALYYALFALTLLSGDPDDEETAKLASEIVARLFADRLTFTQLQYTSQWAHADRLINDIDAAPEPGSGQKKPLADTIDKLVGRRFLAFVRRAHLAYGEALEITKAGTEAPGGVREPKRRVEVAIIDYVIALFAALRPNESDQGRQTVLQALAPIDKVRAEQSRSPAPQPVTRPAEPSEPALPPPPPEPAGPPPSDPIPTVE